MNAVTDMPEGKHAEQRPELAAYSDGYRRVARAHGLRLIDTCSVWERMLSNHRERFLKLVPDGIHPQLPGYREVLLPLLREAVGDRSGPDL